LLTAKPVCAITALPQSRWAKEFGNYWLSAPIGLSIKHTVCRQRITLRRDAAKTAAGMLGSERLILLSEWLTFLD